MSISQATLDRKVCTRCKVEHPLEVFRWLKRKHRGKPEQFRDSWCPDCRRAHKREPAQREKATAAQKRRFAESLDARAQKTLSDRSYYERHRDAVLSKNRLRGRAGAWLDNRLKKKYGITLKEYAALAAAQGHKCLICQQPEIARWRRLAIDHDHKSKRVRGLLCHHCNTGLGNFYDRPDLLMAAIAYLAR